MIKRMMLLACLFVGTPALAQQSVYTLPAVRSATNASGTIAVTNTFQALFAAASGRKACLIQNNSARNMYVYFGTLASATLTNSIILAASQSIACTNNGIINADAVSITGTATDAFYASQQ